MKVSEAVSMLQEHYNGDDEIVIVWWGNDSNIDPDMWGRVVESTDIDYYVGQISDCITETIDELGGE